MAITGINTAPIKKDQRLHVMTLKLRDENQQDRVLYLPLTALVDLLIVLRSRSLTITARLGQRGDAYQAKMAEGAQALARNVPPVLEHDVMRPDADNLVMSLAPKMRDEGFSLIMHMQNDRIVMVDVEDAQVEFMIMAIRRAIEVIDDRETLNLLASLLDFILLGVVDLSTMAAREYRDIPHEGWKQALFTDSYAVLYGFDTRDGEKILAGIMMKCSAEPGSEALDSVVKRIAAMTPALQALQQHGPVCRTFTRNIPTEPGQILTNAYCLSALQDFCAEVQA